MIATKVRVKRRMMNQFSDITFGEMWTKSFSDYFPDVETFLNKFHESPFNGCIKDESATILYYMLLGRYGESSYKSFNDYNNMLKTFTIIYQYGPTWEKRVELQKIFREMTLDKLKTGTLMIFNHAFNPTVPLAENEKIIKGINEQNTNQAIKNDAESYSMLWSMLKVDVSEYFLDLFNKLFLQVVQPQIPAIYTNDGLVGGD